MAGRKQKNQSVNLDVAEEDETEITAESNAAGAPAGTRKRKW